MNDILKKLIQQFMPFAQKQIGFEKPPRLFLRTDPKNAENPLGNTAHYNPDDMSVTLYVSGRHPKDILRSLGHELVHHKQNCDGKFDGDYDTGPGYAQKNPHLRQMEMDANRDGSMCLRDFEDMLKKKNTIYYEHLQKGDKKMSTKDWKNKEIRTLLAEAWGFKFNTLEEFDAFNGDGEMQTEGEEEAVEELAMASKSERPRQPRMQRKAVDDERDEKKVDEGEDHDDDEKKMEEGEGHDDDEKKMEEGEGHDDDDKMEEGEDHDDDKVEEVAVSSGRQSAHADRRGDDERKRPMEEGEDHDDDKVEESDSQEELKEAIAAVLRKHLRG